eukprot:TRINITY_DN29938_c0_g1_i1.p1 TRINITY_DN29938_c0_g1~~TRINITY_DN29938_c0_g1_i1.p1  ORF type:complete len:237 (+),score=27.91 TRINITY_DN29938_c0_g1_i1:50-712(+)
MKLVIDAHYPSQDCRAVEWLLEYLGKECEVVDKRDDPGFMEGNPFGEVPVLVSGDFRVGQCSAIMEYVGDGGILPNPIDVAEYVGIHYSVVRKLTSDCFARLSTTPTPTEAAIQSCADAIEPILTRVDGILSRQTHIAGKELTFADFMFTCEADQLARYNLLEDYPNIRKYLKNMSEVKFYKKHLDNFDQKVQTAQAEANPAGEEGDDKDAVDPEEVKLE